MQSLYNRGHICWWYSLYYFAFLHVLHYQHTAVKEITDPSLTNGNKVNGKKDFKKYCHCGILAWPSADLWGIKQSPQLYLWTLLLFQVPLPAVSWLHGVETQAHGPEASSALVFWPELQSGGLGGRSVGSTVECSLLIPGWACVILIMNQGSVFKFILAHKFRIE